MYCNEEYCELRILVGVFSSLHYVPSSASVSLFFFLPHLLIPHWYPILPRQPFSSSSFPSLSLPLLISHMSLMSSQPWNCLLLHIPTAHRYVVLHSLWTWLTMVWSFWLNFIREYLIIFYKNIHGNKPLSLNNIISWIDFHHCWVPSKKMSALSA